MDGGARVTVTLSPDALAREAAGMAAAVLEAAVAERGVANAMFATGNSQLGLVDVLVRHTEGVPWDAVTVFHMDEYLGIGPEHPASFQRWIRDRIVVPAKPRGAHYLDGRAPPDEECARYANLLAEHPLDLCCLGIGENGHLAFNDPAVAHFDDPFDVKVVVLDDRCRRQQVGEGHFPTVADVPERALTVTIPALLRATRVVVSVPEARKAEAVRDAITGPVDSSCPASILQRRPQAAVFLEPASASLLPSGG